jgi:hypothetical protein
MSAGCVRTSARVEADSPLDQRAFVSRSGDPVGWLDVGELGELGVYGSPGALRRLAAALLIVADAADELDHGGHEPARAAA